MALNAEWLLSARLRYFSLFLTFYLVCLALQMQKTEHMEMKITQPTFGILVALTKNELNKMT